MGWVAVHYTLDDECWGVVLEDEVGGVYSYEQSGRRVVPSFDRLEHARLFARQWPERPDVEDGGTIDLGALARAVDGVHVEAHVLDDAVGFALAVIDAAGCGEDFASPTTDPLEGGPLGPVLARFREVIEQLDRPQRPRLEIPAVPAKPSA